MYYYHVDRDLNNKATLQSKFIDTTSYRKFDIPTTKYEIIINVDGVLHSSFKGNTLENIPEFVYTTLNNLKDVNN